MMKSWFMSLALAALTISTYAEKPYALYIPARGNKETLPVIYLFDPHGNGSLPVNKYKPLADAFGFILVGSNLSKNGNDMLTTERIWQQLYADTRSRLKLDERRLYTCGFSGGAKAAGYIAIRHPDIRGVIAGGAGLPDYEQPANFSFSFTAIAGEGDMNQTELVAVNEALNRTTTRHRILFFDGKHEWAPISTMEQAFAGLQLDAMRSKFIPPDHVFIDSYIAKSKARVEAYNKNQQLIKADQEYDYSITILDGLSPEVGWFRQQQAQLIKNPAYQQQRQTARNLLAKEQEIKSSYMPRFQQADMNYWSTTISDLKGRAAVNNNEKAMNQRLLAFLSLAFYSYSNQLIAANNNNSARYFVELYKLVDPTNSEAWYFSAVLDMREGHPPSAEADLKKAVDNGFRDQQRLDQQPEFKALHLHFNFR